MNQPGHRARIDEHGNIILPGAVPETEKVVSSMKEEVMNEGEWHSVTSMNEIDDVMPWNDDVPVKKMTAFENPVFSDDEPEEIMPSLPEEIADGSDPIMMMLQDASTLESPAEESAASDLWQNVRGKVYSLTNELIEEGGRQYQTSFVDGISTGHGVVRTLKNASKKTWSFLSQPVWVPGRRNQPKQYGRGVLFALDVVRFGGTFASLFVILFVTLNFQSFWSIAQSYVNPIGDSAYADMLTANLDEGVAAKLKKIPELAVAGTDGSTLAAYLPEVGPPENRLIIPKLDINVPIVVPTNEDLIKEDWKALEEDIQTALQDGVVHYPGTARPGQAGNFFVTGHSSYFPWAPGKFKSVFARLGDLKVGDEYWVYYGGDKHRYVISEKKEIVPSDVTVLDQPISKRISTLMTCTPVGTTLRRLILIAQEIDNVTGEPLAVGEHGHEDIAPTMKTEMLPI